MITLIFLILELVTAWKVFEKYGEAGWKALIPFYNQYVEFGKIWLSAVGIIYMAVNCIVSGMSDRHNGFFATLIYIVLGLLLFLMRIIFAYKKSLAFGKGMGFTIIYIIAPFIGNLILGFGSARYLGNKTEI